MLLTRMRFMPLALGLSGLAGATLATADEDLLAALVPKKVAISSHACVLATNGKVKCWGSNSQGQLGVGTNVAHGAAENTMGNNLPYVDLGPNVAADDICVGGGFSCVTTTTGAVKCWGSNSSGVLGQERAVNSVGLSASDMGAALPFTKLGDDFNAKKVECGVNFACALSDAGKVKCWGDARNGSLGYTPANNQTIIGTKTGQMGANLPYLAISTPVSQLSLGATHACAVSENKIYCWGTNQNGEVGNQVTTSPILLPKDEAPIPEVKLEPANVPVTIETVRTGNGYSCATYFIPPGDSSFIPRKFKCWGNNSSGQLGNGSTTSYGRGSMGASLPSVDLDLNEIFEFRTYDQHACAKNAGGTLKCWGRNSQGQLGTGDSISRGNSSSNSGKNIPFVELDLPISFLSSGPLAQSTCAILINHELKCWGPGGSGTLGYEDTKTRGATQTDMGENLPYVRLY